MRRTFSRKVSLPYSLSDLDNCPGHETTVLITGGNQGTFLEPSTQMFVCHSQQLWGSLRKQSWIKWHASVIFARKGATEPCNIPGVYASQFNPQNHHKGWKYKAIVEYGNVNCVHGQRGSQKAYEHIDTIYGLGIVLSLIWSVPFRFFAWCRYWITSSKAIGSCRMQSDHYFSRSEFWTICR